MKYQLYIITLLLFVACQNKNFGILEIDVRAAIENKDASIPLSVIANKVKYIPLETCSNSLLNGVNKVYMTDSFIWVSDYSKLLQFSLKGRFVKRIGKRGKGPGELGRRIRFDINETVNEIYVHSHRNFIYVFDLQTGAYKRSFKVNRNVCRIAAWGDGNVVTFNYDSKVFSKEDDDLNEALVFNKTGQCIDSIPDFTRLVKPNQKNIDLQKMLLGYPEVMKIGDILLYKSIYKDTLWQLAQNRRKEPCLTFRTNNPYSAKEMEIDPSSNAMQLPKMLVIHKTLIFSDYIFLNIEKGYKRGLNRDLRRIFYSKETDKAFSLSGLKNDLHSGPDFWPDMVTNGKMVDWMEAMDIIEYYQQNKTIKEMSKKFKTLASKVSIDSNPVLVVAE